MVKKTKAVIIFSFLGFSSLSSGTAKALDWGMLDSFPWFSLFRSISGFFPLAFGKKGSSQDESPAFLNDFSRFLEGLHGPGNAYPVGPHQKAKLFVGEGKLNGIAFLASDAVFLGKLGEDTIEPVLQV